MEIKEVMSNKAPKPFGSYSQALEVGDFVFVSGQIPFNQEKGEMVRGDIKEQTRQIMDNFCAILEEAGTSINKAVKTTVFVKDMDDFDKIDSVYSKYFDGIKPVRSIIEVSRLHNDVGVKMDIIAAK